MSEEFDSETKVGTSPLSAEKKVYRGLQNQGATCYMNSLLQTLFMTPEFRRTLFSFSYDETLDPAKESCIPYQLQRLFGLLQGGGKLVSCSTKQLTNSFGWKGHEAYAQHDVQELCRVLFDALEKTFESRPPEFKDFINNLYQGKSQNICRCLECHTVSEKDDVFLDLQVPIRAFGKTEAFKTIHESLDFVLESTLLEGENQYQCDHCNAKHDARRGMRFVSMPEVMTFQLERFAYDFVTFRRNKINDKFQFPFFFDLNPFVGHRTDDAKTAKPTDLTATILPEDKLDLATETVRQLIEIRGQYFYELYSVCIHSGSAFGGHYYAYIKDLDTNEWHEFNDSRVMKITETTVLGAWGEAPKVQSWSMGGANAYMLLYRKCNPVSVARFPSDAEVPEYIKGEIEEESKSAYTYTSYGTTTKLCTVSYEGDDYTYSVDPKYTIGSLKAKIIEDVLGKTPVFPSDWKEPEVQIRMTNGKIRVEKTEETMSIDDIQLKEKIWKGKWTYAPFTFSAENKKTLSELKWEYSKSFAIEMKDSSGEFVPYDEDSVFVKGFWFDPAAGTLGPREKYRCSEKTTLAEFKSQVGGLKGVDPNSIRVMKIYEAPYSAEVYRANLVSGDDRQITSLYLNYAEIYCEIDDVPLSASPSVMYLKAQKQKKTLKHSKLDKEDATEELPADLSAMDVSELYETIGSNLGLAPNSFILKYRYESGSAFPLDNTHKKLMETPLAQATTILVLTGKSVGPDEMVVHVAVDSSSRGRGLGNTPEAPMTYPVQLPPEIIFGPDVEVVEPKGVPKTAPVTPMIESPEGLKSGIASVEETSGPRKDSFEYKFTNVEEIGIDKKSCFKDLKKVVLDLLIEKKVISESFPLTRLRFMKKYSDASNSTCGCLDDDDDQLVSKLSFTNTLHLGIVILDYSEKLDPLVGFIPLFYFDRHSYGFYYLCDVALNEDQPLSVAFELFARILGLESPHPLSAVCESTTLFDISALPNLKDPSCSLKKLSASELSKISTGYKSSYSYPATSYRRLETGVKIHIETKTQQATEMEKESKESKESTESKLDTEAKV